MAYGDRQQPIANNGRISLSAIDEPDRGAGKHHVVHMRATN
jgi:hypothetical protein